MTIETRGQNGTTDRFKSGFTLIELLVVIVIIAILSGLLLTAISAARRFADRTKAGLEIRSLETALNKYYIQYRKWPVWADLGIGDDPELVAVRISGDLASMLQGVDAAGQNAMLMPFIRFQKFDAAGDPVNPWQSEPTTDDHYYYFKIDANFDNTIEGTGDTAAPPENSMRRPVIVWTKDVYRDVLMGSWEG